VVHQYQYQVKLPPIISSTSSPNNLSQADSHRRLSMSILDETATTHQLHINNQHTS
jgi:hypothetical protein